MIDVHCHYLPDVDDGAATIHDSIALLRLAVQDQTNQAILTPHVFAGRWGNTRSSLQPKFDSFCKLVRSKEIELQLFLGGEVRLQSDLFDLVMRDEIPYVGGWEGSRVMLLELEDGRIPVGTLNGVQHLKRQGILPMLAHPERNREVMTNFRLIEPLFDEGCLLQITAASVVGGFGPRAEATAHRLLEQGWVHFVASDAHNLTHRPPLMRPARDFIRERFGGDVAKALTEDNPSLLLQGRIELGIS